MVTAMRRFLTTGETALQLNVLEYRVRQLLRARPDLCTQVGKSRCVDPRDLAKITAALAAKAAALSTAPQEPKP